MKFRAFFLGSFLVVLGVTLFPRGAAANEWVDIPRPKPGAVEERVAQQLERAHEALDRLLAGAAGTREKAASFGELGQIYAAYELWDASRACFLNAAAIDPQGPSWAYLLGWIEQQRGDLEAARGHLQDSAERSGDLASWIRLGQVLIELDQADAASRAFGEANEIVPSASAYFGLGRAAVLRGDHARAVAHFEKTLQLQPGATSVRYPLALALRELGRVDEARAQIARRGDVSPSFDDPLIAAVAAKAQGGAFYKFQGDQLVLAGDLRGAALAYEEAVAAAPKNFYARKSLGLTLYHLGDRAGARAHLEAGLPFLEDVPDREIAQTYFTLGSIAANERREDDALALFQTALEHDASFASAHLQLGNLAGRNGNRDVALRHFSRAIELNPDLVEARMNRATTLMDLGRFAEAVPDLESLNARAPGDERLAWLLDTARRRSASP